MENLKNETIDQILICSKNSALHNFCKNNHLPYKSFTVIGLFLFVPFLISLWNLQNKYQIVHCHESKGHTLGFIARFVFRSSLKTVIHRRVLFPLKQKKFTLLKYSPKYADTIICISQAVENVVKKAVPDSNTVIIPSGVPFDLVKENSFNLKEIYGIPIDKKIVGYIAALSFEKDHHTFLDSAKLILRQFKNVHFVIIGEGVLYNDILNYSDQLGIKGQVTFTGFLNNITEAISQIDILLFTSKSEGLGSTILDFFVHKRPVVSARNGGAEELIIDGETGFLCDIGDSSCFSWRVMELLKNEDKVKAITHNAYLFAQKNYAAETIAKRVFAVYNRLAVNS
jgi:glycosyltransferase involved in cell wall biosynthesis